MKGSIAKIAKFLFDVFKREQILVFSPQMQEFFCKEIPNSEIAYKEIVIGKNVMFFRLALHFMKKAPDHAFEGLPQSQREGVSRVVFIKISW